MQTDKTASGIGDASAPREAVVPERHNQTLPELSRVPRAQSDPKLPVRMFDDVFVVNDFSGRVDTLHNLREALLPTDRTRTQLRTYALCGFGGIGKLYVV